eukprot:1781109-Rhodomonas_salina.2
MHVHPDDALMEMQGGAISEQEYMLMQQLMQHPDFQRDMLREQSHDGVGFPVRSRSAMGSVHSNNPSHKNYTFGNDRLHKIGRENQNLLGRIQRIAEKGSNATGAKPGGGNSRRVSSQTINRRKKEMEIARENQRIAE